MTLRFRSRSEHMLDDKGRLSIPTRFRDVLREAGEETLVITNWQQCLKAFPASEWEKFEAKLLGEGRSQSGLSQFVRYAISGVSECTLDRQGRVLLPPALRQEFNIEKEVVLNGMLDHFEIWERAAWQQETRQARGNFSSFQEGLSNLGIL
ncbi:MAG: division/cell wall cluster transcriptional repressor MraZ [Desulfobulbaceae bacterium A2]|nr:MAG: division/cell wall cluster transcriptional repressor MraZ [Desulfobulbaceae bacterium A2]